ncbi:MAG: RNA-metabolising metallo-beta-lactamase [Candidatus Daviesbacteria bacterium GW2011_GWB1_41_5]|uniref:Ribonuclease J n=1 Tax=Candidatus Daviesbacteria bacterium GW2011_GWB1_41_5 TaxID=1618429 RepID=A0A0G0WN55_9BACT|nr:MAG: RNA-metabolising metallo-beta-lactamase [Candidatus Daviesbacteria bacterium GW2011_GWB1_41_5]
MAAPKFGVLKLIPLGGIGDVTKNMYVYEYGQDIMVVDCGIGFPDEGMLGIDLVIPDVSYLKDKKHRIKGIVITHAHDDHIGGLPYLWPDLGAPIYAQKLAAGFIRAKFTEHNLPKDAIKVVDLSTKLKLGVFNISFYRVSHSVPDSVGMVIDTPAGRIIHQADFKIDFTPVTGEPTDLASVALAGREGVDLMLIDSLRVERAGYNLSEKVIEPTFAKIEAETKGKVLITTTSSNLGRIQQAINVAVNAGRKVALVGRSMEGNFQVARDLGYIQIPPQVIIPQEEIKRFPDQKLLVLIAGAFGQVGSALSRAANNDHRFVTILPDDSVVFSADPIPSTEAAQHALIDKITKAGANVYYTAMTDDLHISGHAAREELKVMISLAKPKYLMPIGATYRQMKAFSNMVEELGWGRDKILLAEDGQIINLSRGGAELNGRIDIRNVYVDGLGVGDVGSIVLRDRQVMAEEGIVLVIVPIDQRTSEIVGEPDIVSRGFVFEKASEELLDYAKKVVESTLRDHPHGILDWRFMRQHIEENLERFFYQETKRRPMILPVIVEV